MTPDKINMLKSASLWIWQGSHGAAWVALNVAALLEDIDQLVKILGGLVIMGSGLTTWYFAIKKNKNKPIKKRKR